jgi:NitT/TauT family transport system substrate-binding protein
MFRLLRTFAALACALELIAPGAAGAQSHPLQKATLMLNWYPYGEHAALYYGVEHGEFAKEGIDLTIQPGGGSNQTVQAVAQGQVTFGYADTPALIKNVAAGASVKSIGVILQTTAAAVEFFTDKNIKTVADLKGKTLAGSPGDAAYETVAAVLAANHVPDDAVQRVNVDPAGKLAALISGRVDTLAGFFNDQAPTIEARSGKSVSVLKFSDSGVSFLGTGMIVSDATLSGNPALCKAFMRAVQHAYADAAKDRAGAVAAEEKLATKPPDHDVLVKQFNETLTLLHTAETRTLPVGVDSSKDWQTTIGVLVKYLGLKNPAPPATYWDESIARG